MVAEDGLLGNTLVTRDALLGNSLVASDVLQGNSLVAKDSVLTIAFTDIRRACVLLTEDYILQQIQAQHEQFLIRGC